MSSLKKLSGNRYYVNTKPFHRPAPLSPTTWVCLTLCDLSPGSFEMIAAGNLSNHDQYAIVSMLERSSRVMLSAVLNRLVWFCLLHRGSRWDRDFHGNSATNGRWALFHLHDNCIQSEHHDSARWGGRSDGRGSEEAKHLIGFQVMLLFDVAACHWTERREGYENWCWSYFLYEAAEA